MEDKPHSKVGGVTYRSIAVGALVAALLGIAAPYESLIVSGSPLHFDYSTPAAVFIFFLFLVVASPLFALIRPSWRFTKAEYATVYVMAAVACTLATSGLVAKLLPHISAGTYYATPENSWVDMVLPHFADWLRVTDQQAITWFYEGLPKGTPLPWGEWIPVLLAWTPFLLALYGSMTAIMVIMRRQWLIHERLTFPLVQVPIAIIGEEEEDPGVFSRFFRSPAAWIGILVPIVLYSMRALHNYYPAFPEGMLIWKYYYFWDAKFRLRLSLSYAVVGFGYLLSTKLGFSLWMLGLLTSLEHAFLLHFGIPGTQHVMGTALGSSYLVYQGLGAIVVLAASTLWVARRHLYNVWRKFWAGADDVDDSDEILSYRQAVSLLLGSAVVMMVWLTAAGMSWWLVPGFLLVTFLVMLGLTRIVSEGGVAVTKAPMIPADVMVGAFGATALEGGNLATMGMSLTWSGGMRVTIMSAVIHSLKLAEYYVHTNRRRLFFAIMLAVVASVSAAVWLILTVGYQHGALNLSAWFFGAGAATAPYGFAAYHLTNPTPVSWEFFGVAGLGGATQLLLTLASKRWLWWPLHPIAFPIGAMWTAHHLMPSIFLAWLVKTTVLRYGGVTWYRKTRPFFLGLILGHYVAGGLWCIIDGFTGMTGNYLFFW